MNQELRARAWAQGILQRTVDSVPACRELVGAIHACGAAVTAHPAVLVLRGVESELDVFPVGQARLYWNPSALAKLDRELEEYWSEVEPEVRQACIEVLELLDAADASS